MVTAFFRLQVFLSCFPQSNSYLRLLSYISLQGGKLGSRLVLPYAYAVGVRPAAIVTEPMDGYLTGCAVHTSGVTWTCTGGVGGERVAHTYKCF